PPSSPQAACTTIPAPGTGAPVGAGCINSSSFPALANPVNPVSFGADNTGVNDSTSAFQSAVNQSDVLVPAGTYLLNGNVEIFGEIRNIRCASGVTLKTTTVSNTQPMIWFAANRGSLAGCTLDGGGPHTAPINTLPQFPRCSLTDSRRS